MRDAKKREEKRKIEQDVRKKHIRDLREKLYGSLSLEQLKPHIVLEFFEIYDRIRGELNAKTNAYRIVSQKYPVCKSTVLKFVKEYESVQIFSKNKRGRHPKTIWALQDENVRELFVQKVRELRTRESDTAKWFLSTEALLQWVNSELLSKEVQERNNKFSMNSLHMWLHKCGFHHGEIGKKGVYYDGHERSDVRKRRTEYIATQREKHRQYVRYDETLLDNPDYRKTSPRPFWNRPRGSSRVDALPILKVSHDESIFRLHGFVSR